MALEVTTADGRSLEVLVAGPEDGVPLVFHHGTPQGAVTDPSLVSAAADVGLRVVAYARPGYGASTPRTQPGTVADDAADVATILDHLGLDAFVTAGWSGGGPRSLACAAMLPQRCLGAVCGVGLAPAEEYNGDVRDGMGPENVEEYTAALAGPDELGRWMELNAAPTFAATAETVVEALGGLLPPVDQEALTGELAERTAQSFQRAGAQGTVGWLHDDLALVRPWGFSVRDITVPVSVWQGTEDLMVPLAHAEWLAAHVPGARAHLVPGEGHLSLLARMPRILADLVDLADLAR